MQHSYPCIVIYTDVIDIDRTSKKMYVYGSATITQNIEWKKKSRERERERKKWNDIDVCERMITISIGDNYDWL